MNIASMFLRILAILGALAAAAMFWIIGDTKAQLETELQSTENNLRQTEGQLDTTEEELAQLEEQNTQLNEELEDARAEANQFENQLTQVRRELEEAREAASARERESEALRSEAAQIRRQLLDERNRIAELEDNLEGTDREALQASVEELERQLLETERRLQTVETEDGEAGEGETEEPAREIIRGQVVEVGADGAVVRLNVGTNRGVREDSTVMIRRGPRYIGRAIISQVNENTSVAEVQAGAARVEAGDIAVTLN